MRARLGFALGPAALCLAALVAPAPAADATPPANASAILRIHPGGRPARFGEMQNVEADVSGPSGAGLDGVEVDFEVTGGPGDHDGNTPQTPDLTCVTAGGDKNHPSTCAVSYAEQQNLGGSDGVLAWIDADGQYSTVEADTAEGENENAPGSGGCAAGTKGPGDVPEPDATDCAEKRWQARVASTVDVAPKASSGPTGSVVTLAATVRDQFGDLFAGFPGSATTVSFELLAGSAHDPGDGSDFSTPDLGTCVTGPAGSCSVTFTESTGGTDVVCAYLSGASGACAKAPDSSDSPASSAAADVVPRSWVAPPPPPTGDQSSGTSAPPPARSPSDPPHHKRAHARPKRRPQAPVHAPAPPPAHEVQEKAPPAPRPPQPQRSSDPRRHPHPHHRRRAHSRTAASHGRRSRHEPGPAPAPHRATHRPARHRRHAGAPGRSPLHAALTAAHKLSFPLALMLLVVAFLAVQGRLDRRDPKLRLAPLDSEHDLLPFA